MITCPKCDSKNVIRAEDEAPAWAKMYMKCFACGNRWDLAGPAPKCKQRDEEEGQAETDELEPAPVKLGGDDLVSRVMSGARHQPVPDKKETTMGTPQHLCKEIVRTGTRCTTGRAKGSDYCQRHLAKREQGTAPTLPDAGTPKRTYTRRIPLGGGTAVSTLPAKRSSAPIVLAEPTMINPPLIGNGHVAGIDALIGKFETDLATLRRAKELMERVG